MITTEGVEERSVITEAIEGEKKKKEYVPDSTDTLAHTSYIPRQAC